MHMCTTTKKEILKCFMSSWNRVGAINLNLNDSKVAHYVAKTTTYF